MNQRNRKQRKAKESSSTRRGVGRVEGIAGPGESTSLTQATISAKRIKELVFEDEFVEDLSFWASTNPRIAKRVLDLVKEIKRTPFKGTGKPEPLKYDFEGCWSRRITQEHRLVYYVDNDRVTFLVCRYHYSG